MDWQPIETAPKDGSRVLLFVEGEITVGFWCDYCQIPQWRDIGDIGLAGIDEVSPTHWMPLPPPPKEQGI